jgi:hypothetical protein
MPPSPPPFPQTAPPKKTNWWLIGCGGCLTLIVLAIIGGGAIFLGVVNVIKSTEPYKTAVTAATNSPEVQEELGTPIEPGFMPLGSVNTNSAGGVTTESADLTIPLKGPKASGSLHYAAKKSVGEWEVSDFTVTVEGSGKKIHVAP